jgi:glycosyltransferase involved in cell wall biosynthesis
MSDPLVSVLVTTYNQEAFLPTCLESLVGQTLPRHAYEMLVVNDGSTDGTSAVLASYHTRLRLVTHPSRRGLPAACNSGLAQMRGRYLVRVDSDDWLKADALDQLIRAAESACWPDLVIPDYWVVEETGQPRVVHPDPTNVFTWMAAGPLLRREAVLQAGGYRDFFWEEYDLYLRLLMREVRMASLARAVLYHREHGASMTASAAARADGWQQLITAWTLGTLCRFGAPEECRLQAERA